MNKTGFFSWAQKYGSLWQELTTMSQDNQITVEESQKWVAEVRAALGGAAPKGESEPAPGSSVEKGNTAK